MNNDTRDLGFIPVGKKEHVIIRDQIKMCLGIQTNDVETCEQIQTKKFRISTEKSATEYLFDSSFIKAGYLFGRVQEIFIVGEMCFVSFQILEKEKEIVHKIFKVQPKNEIDYVNINQITEIMIGVKSEESFFVCQHFSRLRFS